MKKKIILKTVLSSIGILSATIPFALNIPNQINLLEKNNSKNQADNGVTNSNSILSDDVQDVNQATQNGFVGKTNTSVFSSNFYGELLWYYDLTQSQFLKNEDGTQKSPTNFIVKYNENNNTVAVVGSYQDQNKNDQSFFFQLHADTGLPYFSNEDPSLSEQEKYNSSVIISEKNFNLIKNPSSIIFNGNFATIFNEKVLSDSDNNKPTQINLLTLDAIQLTFDNSFFEGIKKDYVSNVFLGASFLEDGNILVTTGSIDTNSNKLTYVRAFVLTNTLKSIIIRDDRGQLSASRLTLVSVNNSAFLPSGIYSANEVIRDIFITNTSVANISTVTYIFTGTRSVFRTFSYNSSTNILTTSNTTFLSPNNQNESISYLTEDKVNRRIYFTTTTSGKELMYFDVANNYSLQTLSSDTKYSGAKISSFLPSTDASQLLINKIDGNIQKVYGYQTNIGGNTQGEISIFIPEISDYTVTAKAEGLYNNLPSDVTEEQAKKVLKITNYASSDYSTELVPNTLVANNDAGTISFDLNLSINQWWDKKHPKMFVSKRSINLTGLPTVSSQKFQLVTNASIDATKYEEVYKLQQNIYLSELTKQNIFDYFISYGSGLSFTVNDISLNEENSTKQIQAKTNNNTGVLTISYNITTNSDKISLNSEYKIGEKTWQFNKKLDNYKQLQLSNVLINNLKSSKYSGDVSLDDLVSSVDFAISGTGYSTDIKNWQWEPTYQIGSTEWINQQLKGELSGTLKYVRTESDPSSNLVPDSYFTLNINQDGFKQLRSFIFGDNLSTDITPISFNQTLADNLTVTSNKQEATNNLKEIITQTTSTTNSWVSSNQIEYSINEFKSTNTQLVVNINISPIAQTNISIGNMSNITLNNNWVQELMKISPNLFNQMEITLNISVATYSWNIAKANESSVISMNDINSPQLNTYSKKLPSDFVKAMSSSPDDFQKITNLLNQSNDLNYKKQSFLQITGSSSNSGDFIIQSIQLTPNDETGTITANYTLVYPNLNNVSKVASVTISGFLSVWDIIIFWIMIIIAIAIICVIIWLSVSYIKKNYKKKRIWSTHNFIKNFKKVKN